MRRTQTKPDAPSVFIVKTIKRLERLRNSPVGNPTWRLHFTDGTRADTSRDASVGYVIDHQTYEGVPLVLETRDDYVIGVKTDVPPGRCPDSGKCHHECVGGCFRVNHCGPLTIIGFPGDRWPDSVKKAYPEPGSFLS